MKIIESKLFYSEDKRIRMVVAPSGRVNLSIGKVGIRIISLKEAIAVRDMLDRVVCLSSRPMVISNNQAKVIDRGHTHKVKICKRCKKYPIHESSKSRCIHCLVYAREWQRNKDSSKLRDKTAKSYQQP